jgi:hypothetical protein
MRRMHRSHDFSDLRASIFVADATKTRAAADALKAKHEARLGDVQERERQAIAASDAARQAVAKADDARVKADAKEKEFQDKIDRLQAGLRAASADF